jgi:hypothetical protein
MSVSGVSDTGSMLATQATAMKASTVQTSIQMSVTKQLLDQQKDFGNDLVKMINTAAPGHVDIRV